MPNQDHTELQSQPTKKSYLVIRLGRIYDNRERKYLEVDPISEIDKILSSKGSCLFAKFGRSLGKDRLDTLVANSQIDLVVVVSKEQKYISKTFKILAVPPDSEIVAENYPKYYRGKEGQVGTWLQIASTLDQVQISSLSVGSSGHRLSTSMGSSSSSFFFCKIR